jgi:hypothetical protein
VPGPTIVTTHTPVADEPTPPPPKPAKPSDDIRNPAWWTTWTTIRRVGVFLLGAALIIDGISRGDTQAVWPELLIGALMVGAFPIDSLPFLTPHGPHDETTKQAPQVSVRLPEPAQIPGADPGPGQTRRD